MAINRQHLHTLVDMVEESGLDTLYNVMIRFVPEDDPSPDEVEAIARARMEYERGETSFSLDVGERLEKINFDDLEEDEKQAILQGREDYKNGDTYSSNEIDWDNLDKMDLG